MSHFFNWLNNRSQNFWSDFVIYVPSIATMLRSFGTFLPRNCASLRQAPQPYQHQEFHPYHYMSQCTNCSILILFSSKCIISNRNIYNFTTFLLKYFAEYLLLFILIVLNRMRTYKLYNFLSAFLQKSDAAFSATCFLST